MGGKSPCSFHTLWWKAYSRPLLMETSLQTGIQKSRWSANVKVQALPPWQLALIELFVSRVEPTTARTGQGWL